MHATPDTPPLVRQRHFATTQWSMVVAAGKSGGTPDARAALSALCETYWYPLYVFVRGRVGDAHQAQDLTQAFFAHLLERHAIAAADRERGRFRAFLLTALKNFMANEWARQNAEKRGGGRKAELSLDFDAGESRYQVEPSHRLTPERLFERRWVLTLIEQVLETLRAELASAGKADHFAQLKDSLLGGATADDVARAAAALNITPAAAKQSAYRMRKRYRQLFRDEVARTVADDADVDDEIGKLLETLSA